MAIDTSKLKGVGRRRGLGTPPADGSPGIEEATGPDGNPAPAHTPEDQRQRAAADASIPTSDELYAGPPPTRTKQSTTIEAPKNARAAEGAPRATGSATGRWKDEPVLPRQRQRVPPQSAAARVPFTTRITLETKDRLEDACHHLRMKHQDFIEQALEEHLRKRGF